MSLTTHAQTMAEKPLTVKEDDSKTSDQPLPLTYKAVTRDSDKQVALRLVVDSIAQQRQVASAAIIFNPLCLTVLVAACAVTYRRYEHQGYGMLMTMFSGVFIVYLSVVRFSTSTFLQLAENFRWKTWIAGPDGKDDTVLVAIYGNEIIGTVVLRLEGSSKKKGGAAPTGEDAKGVIRAWTTRLRYRGKGVGSDLLQLAVQTTREALGPKATVEFAPDHANSNIPLPEMFSRVFRKRQDKAVKALAEASRNGDAKN